MKIVCFIGSGFNYMLSDIVKQKNIYTKDDTPLNEKLISLNKLWDQIEETLSPFSNLIPTTNGEELIGILEGIQAVYSKFTLSTSVKPSDPTDILNNLISAGMQKVGEQFTRFEQEGGYSAIYSAFPSLGLSFSHLLKGNNVRELYLCTTNYDGIIDSLLTYYCEDDARRKFILKDGFIHGHFNDRLFRSFEHKIAHIHGSYKYFKGTSGTQKLERCSINRNPVMIYNSPNRKESSILQDPVLTANFLELERKLKVCDRVIIIGNSFKTEPHLKRLINTHFNRPNTQIIISSDKPEDVVSTLEPYYNFPIYTQTTTNIKSEQHLIELFKNLFDANYYRMLATA